MLMLHKQFAWMIAFAKSIEQPISAFRPVWTREQAWLRRLYTPLLSSLQAFDEDKQEISLSNMFGLASRFTSHAPHGIWCWPGGFCGTLKASLKLSTNFLDPTNSCE